MKTGNLNAGYGQAQVGATPYTTGKIFLVAGSGNANFNNIDGLYVPDSDGVERRVSTIEAAINLCTANANDIILVAPNHTETVSAASGFDMDVAGVSLIGLGKGDNRPTITFDTAATADVNFGASNLLIKNIIFVNDIDGLAEPLDIEANVTNVTFEDCEFRDDTAAKQTVRWFQTAATNTSIKVINCKHVGSDTAGATAAFTIIGGSKHFFKNLVSNGDMSAANIEIKTTLTSDILIQDCILENANAVDVNIEGNSLSNTGYVVNTSCRNATDGQTTWINNTNLSIFESYGVDAAGGAGTKIGTADSGDIATDVSTILAQQAGAAGIATFPAAAAPANSVSMAEVVRAIFDRQLGDGTDASTNSLLGKRVLKTAETLPATTTQNLFTVSGGRVLITKLVGEVTTVVQAQVCNAKVNNNPTVGSTVVLATNVDINALEVGATLTVEGDGTALVLGNGGTSLNALGGTALEVAEGVIELETSATNTGATKWELWYIPLDDGATVA